ncbi:MAG: hypothetical protein IJ538_02745 [Clostridia bacterium]|nr:hypothetical protein [Clostridia bacterium]
MKTFKCKNCGGKLVYSPEKQTLICENCESQDEIKKIHAENKKEAYSPRKEPLKRSANLYVCKSCSSHLSSPGGEEIKRCPNCGNVELERVTNDEYIPDAILPFVVGKEKARENFRIWLKKRKFAPNNLVKLAKEGKITGFYTPVWNFDGHSVTEYSGVGVNEYRDGDKVKRTYHNFSGIIENDYQDEFVSANNQVGSETINKLSPWNLENLNVYDDSFVCGFIGSNCEKMLEAGKNEFSRFVQSNDAFEAKSRQSRFDYIESFYSSTKIYDVKYNYLYFPLWVNHYTYKDKKYTSFINGQTGEVAGKSPKSFWKILFTVLGITAVVAAIVILIALKGN